MGTDAENTAQRPPFDPRRLGGAGILALVAGLLVGLVLYLPWDTIWDLGLRHFAQRMAGVRIQWQSVDRAAPLGFRVNGVSVEAPGWPFAPRLLWVDVRLGMSPLVTLRADTGGGQIRAVYLDTGAFDAEGAADLACLGRRDIRGSVDVHAEGRFLRGQDTLEKAFLDLRGKALQLPGGLWLGDAALALEYKEDVLRIRSFTLREPVQVRAEGTATLRPGAIMHSPYAVTGEFLRGRDSFPFSARGVLGDFLGETALPE